MAVAPYHLHLFTHAARMLAVLKEAPGHGRAGEYADQLASYKSEWATLTPAEREAVVLEAAKLPDMTGGVIKATCAHLEG